MDKVRQQVKTPVGGGIIDDDQLVGRPRLMAKNLERVAELVGLIAGRQQHTDGLALGRREEAVRGRQRAAVQLRIATQLPPAAWMRLHNVSATWREAAGSRIW